MGRIQGVAETATYPVKPNGEIPVSASEAVLLARHRRGSIALVVSKTYQGEDARGRPGRYCNQIFVGSASDLPVSAVARLASEHVIQPLTQTIVDSDDELRPDLAPVDLVKASPRFGRWIAIEDLVGRLQHSHWRSVSLAASELALLPELLGVLGENWDEGSDLSIQLAGDDIYWRLSLNGESDAVGQSGSVQDGDPDWLRARKRLAGATTSAELAQKWSGQEPAVEGPPSRDTQVEEAVVAYSAGNTAPLHSLMFDLASTEAVSANEAADAMIRAGVRLSANGTFASPINSLIVPAIFERTSLTSATAFLPTERDELEQVARVHLGEVTFLEVAARNAEASDRDLIRLPHAVLHTDLWLALERCFLDHGPLRQGAIRTLQASGSDASGILRRLIELDPEAVQFGLLFGSLVPATMGHRDAYELIVNHEDEFLAWASLPPFYLETLRRGRGLFGWFKGATSSPPFGRFRRNGR